MRFHFEPLAENVYLSEDGSKVFIIDQTLLPNVSKVIALQTAPRRSVSARGMGCSCWRSRSARRIRGSS